MAYVISSHPAARIKQAHLSKHRRNVLKKTFHKHRGTVFNFSVSGKPRLVSEFKTTARSSLTHESVQTTLESSLNVIEHRIIAFLIIFIWVPTCYTQLWEYFGRISFISVFPIAAVPRNRDENSSQTCSFSRLLWTPRLWVIKTPAKAFINKFPSSIKTAWTATRPTTTWRVASSGICCAALTTAPFVPSRTTKLQRRCRWRCWWRVMILWVR